MERRETESNIPDSISSDLVESSHIKEIFEMEIGICKGFLNSISTFTGSAKTQKNVKKNTRVIEHFYTNLPYHPCWYNLN